MTGIIDFKTDRQSAEWNDARFPQKLKNIVTLLAFYSWSFFQKKVIVTEIFRTPEEQNKIYNGNSKYKKSPWQSVHQFWRGVDLRERDFEKKEIEILLIVANTIVYDPTRPKLQTCIWHDVGAGKHIHVQIK